MRCAACGNTANAVSATHCKLCGTALPPPAARSSARVASGWKDPSAWKRHLLVRAGSPPLELRPGEEWRIGRSSECQVRIQSPRVSRVHALLLWPQPGAGPTLRDLQSQNGTLVGGRPVREHALADGDEVTIGPFVCTYRCVDGIGSTTELQELLDSGEDTHEMAQPAMSGQLAVVSLHELLETLAYNKRTGLVEVFGPWGDVGRIGLTEGRALWAELDPLRGRAAVDALLEWTEGTFRFGGACPAHAPDPDLPPLEQLLEEARRRASGEGLSAQDYGGA